MILNSIICIIVFFGIVGFGYLANYLLNTKFSSLSSLFILGFVLQSIILQIHYIFLPIDFKSTFIYLLFSILLFSYFKNFDFKKLILENKILSLIFLILFIFLQSNSIQYPTNGDIPDYYLYHKNYIDWVNNHPVVEGLALLNPRHGYSGITYLNVAYYNFFPYFNNGWAILTPIFILFFLTIFFRVLREISSDQNTQIKLSNIFILISFYLIFKIILIISKAETSHFLIFTIISIYLFYLLLKNLESFNYQEISLVLIILIFLPTILFSLSVYSFFVFVVITYIYIKNLKFNSFNNFHIIFIYSLLIILPFLYLNYIKSGYFLYPATYLDNFIKLDKSWSVASTLGPALIEGASAYNWAKEKDLSIALITNWPPLILSLSLIPFIFLAFIAIGKLRPFFILFLFCIGLTAIWYLSAPEQRYGTPYVWALLFFEVSVILFLLNFKFYHFPIKKMILFFIVIINLSQLIRYYDDLNLNFEYKYLPDDFSQHYIEVIKDGHKFITLDKEKLLIYNGDNLLVSESLDDFKMLKQNNNFYFRHTRKK